MALTDLQRR